MADAEEIAYKPRLGQSQSKKKAWQQLEKNIKNWALGGAHESILSELRKHIYGQHGYIWVDDEPDTKFKPTAREIKKYKIQQRPGSRFRLYAEDSFEYNFIKYYIDIVSGSNDFEITRSKTKMFLHVVLPIKQSDKFSTNKDKDRKNIELGSLKPFAKPKKGEEDTVIDIKNISMVITKNLTA